MTGWTTTRPISTRLRALIDTLQEGGSMVGAGATIKTDPMLGGQGL